MSRKTRPDDLPRPAADFWRWLDRQVRALAGPDPERVAEAAAALMDLDRIVTERLAEAATTTTNERSTRARAPGKTPPEGLPRPVAQLRRWLDRQIREVNGPDRERAAHAAAAVLCLHTFVANGLVAAALACKDRPHRMRIIHLFGFFGAEHPRAAMPALRGLFAGLGVAEGHRCFGALLPAAKAICEAYARLQEAGPTAAGDRPDAAPGEDLTDAGRGPAAEAGPPPGAAKEPRSRRSNTKSEELRAWHKMPGGPAAPPSGGPSPTSSGPSTC